MLPYMYFENKYCISEQCCHVYRAYLVWLLQWAQQVGLTCSVLELYGKYYITYSSGLFRVRKTFSPEMLKVR